MRFSIDFDDTICDFMGVVLAEMNFKHGINLTKNDLSDYHYFQKNGYDKDFTELLNRFDTTYLRRAMPPTDSFAQPVIKCLQRSGHDIDIVTMNDERAVSSISSWLFMHGIDAKVVALGRGTALGRGSGAKKAEHDYGWYIDDNPSLAAVAHEYPEKTFLRYFQPWNKDVPVLSENVHIVHGWLDVYRVAKEKGLIEEG